MTRVERAKQLIKELLNTGPDVLALVGEESLVDLLSLLEGAKERAPKVSSIKHWSTVLDVVEQGLEGNPHKVRTYAELLLQGLVEDEQEVIVKHLKKVLAREQGQMIYPVQHVTKSIKTPFRFLHGEPLELVLLSNRVLSDQGYTSNAVRVQTAHCNFSAEELEQRAVEITADLDVGYLQGIFFIEQVTEETVQEAVARLENAMLLFYGMTVGAGLALKENEHREMA